MMNIKRKHGLQKSKRNSNVEFGLSLPARGIFGSLNCSPRARAAQRALDLAVPNGAAPTKSTAAHNYLPFLANTLSVAF